MSALSQYYGEILPSLGIAISDAVATVMQQNLKQKIEQMAKENVYSSASGYARGILGTQPFLFSTAAGFSLAVTSNAPMQGTNYGVSETTFVEQGMGNYHMPFARPFMDQARDEYVDGQAHSDLAAVLAAHGFTVI